MLLRQTGQEAKKGIQMSPKKESVKVRIGYFRRIGLYFVVVVLLAGVVTTFLNKRKSNFYLPLELRTQELGYFVSSAVKNPGSTVCWNAPALELVSSRPNIGQDPNIFVSGSGCKSCRIWDTCKFSMIFGSLEAYFLHEFQYSNQPDILVEIQGPALIASEVVPYLVSPTDRLIRGFSVEYTPRFAGLYTVSVISVCGRVKKVTNSSTLLQFPLQVDNVTVHPLVPQLSPEMGSWIVNTSSKDGVAYSEFSHAQRLIAPSDFMMQMVDRGVRTISFVGDSHIRSTFQHLEYLSLGTITSTRVFHENGNWTYHDPRNKASVLVEYLWYNGIYGEKECDRVHNTSYPMSNPLFNPSSDVIVLQTGTWELAGCLDQFLMYSKYLPKFAERMTMNSRNRRAKFYWMSCPPFPSRGLKCNGRKNHGTAAWANRITKMVAESYHIRYLNFWPIVSPVSEKTCIPRNHHYSCLLEGKIVGIVGETVTRVLLHRIALDFP